MKKENVLVIVLVSIAVLGIWSYQNLGSNGFENETATPQDTGEGSHQGIDFKSYFDGMTLAKSQGKPIFLYFYADW